jgi:hypothetical protein
MPEELAIALVVLIAAIWLLVKIVQGTAAAIGRATTSYSEASAKRKQGRCTKRRENLIQYVRCLIPDELDRLEKNLEASRTRLEQARRTAGWSAERPVWRKEKYEPVPGPAKSGAYERMEVQDIYSILTPDPDSSTWSAKETEIIHRSCEYPAARPVGHIHRFTEFPICAADVKTAAFEADPTRLSPKDVARYFSREQDAAAAYNARRADLLARAAALNSAIQEWNGQNRKSWESYIAESERMTNAELLAFECASEAYKTACREDGDRFKALLEGHREGEKKSVIERLNHVLNSIRLPASIPHTWDLDFDEDEGIAVIEVGLPDVVHRPPFKTVALKSGATNKLLNQTEKKNLVPRVHPAILLRIAYEVFRNDADGIIRLLVLNGWVRFDDPATGIDTTAYTASLMVSKDQVVCLNLSKIDPLIAFENLHGKSAGKLIEIIPIEPSLSLNRKDARFVNAKEVLAGLGSETNLAAIDWQDFEHLIRELFEKEFSGRGTEVKITQASRDRGVDAVVFDPDPIHGGKYVIQAKRYTNTVDVSAVRDLCAVVRKEGASRGILVTTSTYGAEAYAFANNEPVTLLNGAELLGLLKKHGYTFRINLEEARRLA